MLLAAVLFAGFIALGAWQVRRERWKLKLIHDVTTRVDARPVPAPGAEKWPEIRAGHLRYLHVRLRGHYLVGRQTLVHGSSKLGYGYWVMAPLKTERGFIVLVNRGYIDASAKTRPKPPRGSVALTGLLRLSQAGGGFLRSNKPRRDQWYSRDVAAIAAARGLPARKVAPYFVDADATASQPGGPVAGLTKIHFRNAHVGYAITWFLLALGTALGAAIVARREWRLV
jgi:surfeit locus 1 family protein